MSNETTNTNIEIVARKLAAMKMGLVKDKNGKKLPDDLWRQMIPKAKELLQTWDLIPKKTTFYDPRYPHPNTQGRERK